MSHASSAFFSVSYQSIILLICVHKKNAPPKRINDSKRRPGKANIFQKNYSGGLKVEQWWCLFISPAQFELRRVPVARLGLAVDGASLLDALRVVGWLLAVTGQSRLKTRSGALEKNISFSDSAKLKTPVTMNQYIAFLATLYHHFLTLDELKGNQ